jgi:hypothetical protein
MGLTAGQLIAVQQASVPFLTQSPFISNIMVKAYLYSIDSQLQGKGGVAYTALVTSLDTIRNNGLMKNLLTAAGNPTTGANAAPGGIRPLLLSLDKIAYQLKGLAGHQFYTQAVSANVTKTLSTTNAEMRGVFTNLIGQFNECYQGDGAAATQTIVHAPPPNTTWRIDRESLSAGPGTRYWTYRIQAGSATFGGMEMQCNVYFKILDVRAALTTSLNSTLTGQGPARYVRLTAPQWLTDILNAA